MWSQAKQRAEEMGSMVLWCDGGDGGVSGIAGRGFHDVTQVGSSSWVRTIGIQYPFDEHQTAYAYLDHKFTSLLFWALCFGGSIGGQIPLARALSAIRLNAVWPLGRRQDTENLIDVD